MAAKPAPIENENENTDFARLDKMLAAIACGDTGALETLYRVTGVSVYSFALSIVKNTCDAEDVMQDCYVAVFTSAAGYVPQGKPLAWILTIVKNLCLQKLRARERISGLPQNGGDIPTAENVSLPIEDAIVIRECLERLRDDERQIVVLHAVSGFKHREIAEMLDMPLSTVLSKYRRAVRKLERYLK